MPIVKGREVPTVKEVANRLLESFGQQAMLNGWPIKTTGHITTLFGDTNHYVLHVTPQQVMGEAFDTQNHLFGRYSYDLEDLSVQLYHVGSLPSWLVSPFEV